MIMSTMIHEIKGGLGFFFFYIFCPNLSADFHVFFFFCYRNTSHFSFSINSRANHNIFWFRGDFSLELRRHLDVCIIVNIMSLICFVLLWFDFICLYRIFFSFCGWILLSEDEALWLVLNSKPLFPVYPLVCRIKMERK